MGMPAARITDLHTCAALVAAFVVPPAGGPIVTGCFTVLTGSLPQARITDKCVCVSGFDLIVRGSPTVLVGGLPASRIGDNTVLGGAIFTGLITVLIGEQSSGGGGAGVGGGGSGTVSATPGKPGEITEAVSGLAASAAAMDNPMDQAKTLIQAAATGTPFCERCAAAAAAARR